MLTDITETHKEQPQMTSKMSPHLQSTTPALEAKKKTQQTSKSADLQSAYLQQFKQYPLPLVLLRTPVPPCLSSWPLLPRYNPIPLLEEQAHQEEDLPAEEEVHQEEVHKEEAVATNRLPNQTESL